MNTLLKFLKRKQKARRICNFKLSWKKKSKSFGVFSFPFIAFLFSFAGREKDNIQKLRWDEMRWEGCERVEMAKSKFWIITIFQCYTCVMLCIGSDCIVANWIVFLFVCGIFCFLHLLNVNVNAIFDPLTCEIVLSYSCHFIIVVCFRIIVFK